MRGGTTWPSGNYWHTFGHRPARAISAAASPVACPPWTASMSLTGWNTEVFTARCGTSRTSATGREPRKWRVCRPHASDTNSSVLKASSGGCPSWSWTTCSNTNGSRCSPDIAGVRPATGVRVAGRATKRTADMTGQILSTNRTARRVSAIRPGPSWPRSNRLRRHVRQPPRTSSRRRSTTSNSPRTLRSRSSTSRR